MGGGILFTSMLERNKVRFTFVIFKCLFMLLVIRKLCTRKERTTLRRILLSPSEIMADYNFWILIGSSRGDDNRITIDDFYYNMAAAVTKSYLLTG